jgi:hypothetical protein
MNEHFERHADPPSRLPDAGGTYVYEPAVERAKGVKAQPATLTRLEEEEAGESPLPSGQLLASEGATTGGDETSANGATEASAAPEVAV